MGEVSPGAALSHPASNGCADTRSAAVVAMAASAISGLLVGLVLRGELATGLVLVLAVMLAGLLGWCVRGIR